MSKSTQVVESLCGHCSKPLDGATSVEGDHTPSENDLSVCAYCGGFNKFDSNLKLVALSKEEEENLQKEHPGVWYSLKRAKELIMRELFKSEMNI